MRRLHPAYAERGENMWQWIRRLVAGLDNPLRPLAVMGGYWILPVADVPRDPANNPVRLETPTVIELPPGHPEQLAGSQPLSPAERELWAGLEGIDW